MIQKADVYTSRPGAVTLALAALPIYDPFYVTNVDGLDPVKASIGTTALGSIDGEIHIGDSVPSRNIVMTLRPNVNYVNWTSEQFRRFIYSYFTPKSVVRLVFTTDEIDDPVEIFGIVESVTANPFVSELEFQISIICPDPYFQSTVVETASGSTNNPGETADVETITNPGDLAVGFVINVHHAGTDSSEFVLMQMGNPIFAHFQIDDTAITSAKSLEVGSERLNKYVRDIDAGLATFHNAFVRVQQSSEFLVLESGDNFFSIITDTGNQDWEIQYYPRYDGI